MEVVRSFLHLAAGEGPLVSRSYKVGILHSLVGTMAESEKPLVDAARLAIEEINASGRPSRQPARGRRGRRPLRAGDVRMRSEAAHRHGGDHHDLRLLDLHLPQGGPARGRSRRGDSSGTPSSTKASRSPRTSSTRAARSTSRWSPRWTGRSPSSDSRFFLVGSDYVYPRTANRLAKALLVSHGGTVAGEALVPLGSVDFSDVIRRLRGSGAAGRLQHHQRGQQRRVLPSARGGAALARPGTRCSR